MLILYSSLCGLFDFLPKFGTVQGVWFYYFLGCALVAYIAYCLDKNPIKWFFISVMITPIIGYLALFLIYQITDFLVKRKLKKQDKL
ncbi:hypothetical protein [Brackiella oedipodis]|uniref:hypothetical protein n=1 Tax=Brackiella oedipodis TaxID=124225 RepID=UPI00048A9765|nr:hypothetical protein [Brackiella oedipodis]